MLRVLLPVLLLCGCAGEQAPPAQPVSEPEALLTGPAQFERLCARVNRDIVTDLFCEGSPPPIGGIVELREALGLNGEVNLLDRGFVLTGHSSSLTRRSVSALNPRIIFVERSNDNRDVAALAFARGDTFSEIVVRGRRDGELQFYLVRFHLPCEQSERGCTPGDLLTDAGAGVSTAAR